MRLGYCLVIDPQIVILRIALALVFGAIIGVEREWRHKAAGIKTNTLVALGSATFSMMSNTFGPNNHNPAQIAASVITGIGFIGAGVIIHRGANVQGVTTAATLWAGASLGMAIGLGYYVVAASVFVAIVIVQFGMRRAVLAVESRRGPSMQQIEVRIECDDDALAAVNAAWSEFAAAKGIVPIRHSTTRNATMITWQSVFSGRAVDVAALEDRLARAGVKKIETRQIASPEE